MLSAPYSLGVPRRIDYLFSYGAAAGDGWDTPVLRFTRGAPMPLACQSTSNRQPDQVSGQYGLSAEFGGPGDAGRASPIGEYDVAMTCAAGCGGTKLHSISVDRWDPRTGSFSGRDFYKPDTSYTWNVTGTVRGARYELEFVYARSNPGYRGTLQGAIDGTQAPATGAGLSPTANQTFDWSATRNTPVGTYSVAMKCESGCSETFAHAMTIDRWDPTTGSSSDTGRLESDARYTWDVTGQVRGTRFNLSFDYTGLNPDYSGEVIRAVDTNGTLVFGLGHADVGNVQKFTWNAVRR